MPTAPPSPRAHAPLRVAHHWTSPVFADSATKVWVRLLTCCAGRLVNLLCRTRNTDPCCGFNAFWREHADALRLTVADSTDGRLWGDGFEIKTLITVRAARGYLRIVEVASIEHPRVHGVSNLNASTDGLRVLGTILMECRQSRKSVVSRRDDVQLDQRMEGVA